MSGVAGPAAVGGGVGSSEGASRDAEMTDDGWGFGDFDAAKILADDDRRWIGDDGSDVHEFDAGEIIILISTLSYISTSITAMLSCAFCCVKNIYTTAHVRLIFTTITCNN